MGPGGVEGGRLGELVGVDAHLPAEAAQVAVHEGLLGEGQDIGEGSRAGDTGPGQEITVRAKTIVRSWPWFPPKPGPAVRAVTAALERVRERSRVKLEQMLPPFIRKASSVRRRAVPPRSSWTCW